ncbi:hypothetical protein POG06_17255, partial [Enterococcus innesii]|nr:hypothetical protein [Enterococcus innesii]
MKKVILVGLMFVVFFGWKDIVSADSVTEENAVISEVKELEQSGKYDFEVVPAEDIDPQNIIQLDSVEELEKILAEFKNSSETEFTINENPIQTRAAGSKTVSQWAPFSG